MKARLEDISEMIENLKFKKKIIGGVDEIDVWKKIEVLNNEYKRLFELQAAEYEAIIENIKSDGDKNVR